MPLPTRCTGPPTAEDGERRGEYAAEVGYRDRKSAIALRFVPSVRPFCWTRARPARLDLPNASCVEMELRSELSVSPDLAVLRTSAVKYSASPLCPPQC